MERRREQRGGGEANQRSHDQAPFVPAAPGFAPAFAGLSRSTNVVATHDAVMVDVGVGLSFPFRVKPLMLTMRVNLPMRSKNIARLWYVPSSSRVIGHSACSCLVTAAPGLKLLIVRFDCAATVCIRFRRSAASFSSGSTALRLARRVSSSAT